MVASEVAKQLSCVSASQMSELTLLKMPEVLQLTNNVFALLGPNNVPSVFRVVFVLVRLSTANPVYFSWSILYSMSHYKNLRNHSMQWTVFWLNLQNLFLRLFWGVSASFEKSKSPLFSIWDSGGLFWFLFSLIYLSQFSHFPIISHCPISGINLIHGHGSK